MTLTLYTAPGSCSTASHIALEEAGADYVAHRMDLAEQEQRSPEFLKVNPKGRVPALLTERGVITETPAILAYIAQSFPASPVAAPSDAFTFAALQAFNGYIASTVHVAHAHGRRGYRWSDDQKAIEAMKLKVPENMADCFHLIETQMPAGPWVMGETFSVADPYLFTMTSWLEGDGVDPKRFPKVLAHYTRMLDRPSVKKVLAAGKA